MSRTRGAGNRDHELCLMPGVALAHRGQAHIDPDRLTDAVDRCAREHASQPLGEHGGEVTVAERNAELDIPAADRAV